MNQSYLYTIKYLLNIYKLDLFWHSCLSCLIGSSIIWLLNLGLLCTLFLIRTSGLSGKILPTDILDILRHVYRTISHNTYTTLKKSFYSHTHIYTYTYTYTYHIFIYIIYIYVCIYTYIYIYIYRESNQGEKNNNKQKLFRLTSLSIHCIYIYIIIVRT